MQAVNKAIPPSEPNAVDVSKCAFLSLPKDVMEIVLNFLPYDGLANLGALSKACRQLSIDFATKICDELHKREWVPVPSFEFWKTCSVFQRLYFVESAAALQVQGTGTFTLALKRTTRSNDRNNSRLIGFGNG